MTLSPISSRSILLRISRTAFVYLSCLFLASFSASAADIQAVLDSNNGTSSFVVQSSTPATVGAISSSGHLTLNGNIGLGVGAGALLGVDNALRPTAASGYLNLLGGAGNARISISDTDIHFATGDATEKVIINNNGNVGINSAAPGAKLDVTGGAARILSGTTAPNIGLATTPGSLYVQENLEVDGSVNLGDANVDNLVIVGTLSLGGSTNYEGAVTITTTDAGALLVRKTDLTNIFKIDTNAAIVSAMGNVGVGTIAPSQRLDVRGNIITDSEIYASSAAVTNNLTAGGNVTVIGLTHAGTLESDGVIYGHQTVGLGVAAPASALDIRTPGGVRIWDGALGNGPGQLGHATGNYDMYVKGALEVDGDVYLGDATTDIFKYHFKYEGHD
ncbi:MAG: hypothetical protein HQL17_05235, partial [Candidatus Omnitrophica bacterium]|nr:hypothetical protein [Candidatus Omnitrophota bacterium]